MSTTTDPITVPSGWRLVTRRTYKLGQGYGATALFRDDADGSPVRVKVEVDCHGALATVASRWDRAAWQEVATVQAAELPDPPPYVVWDWTRASHPTARAHREDCEAWINTAVSVAAHQARLVIA